MDKNMVEQINLLHKKIDYLEDSDYCTDSD